MFNCYSTPVKSNNQETRQWQGCQHRVPVASCRWLQHVRLRAIEHVPSRLRRQRPEERLPRQPHPGVRHQHGGSPQTQPGLDPAAERIQQCRHDQDDVRACQGRLATQGSAERPRHHHALLPHRSSVSAVDRGSHGTGQAHRVMTQPHLSRPADPVNARKF